MATRKRSRITEAEQAADLRRSKRPQNFIEQPLPVQQLKGRKRRLNISESGATGASQKWARLTPDKAAVDNSAEQEEVDNVDSQNYPILYWTMAGHWPKRYSDQSDKNISHLLARQKSSGSLRRKQSTQMSINPASAATGSVAPSSTTPSDQKPREVKSAPYQDARYETLLATNGSFMGKPALAITQTSKASYLHLLDAKQTIPKDSLFCDKLVKETCEMIRNKNEARVIRDVSPFIVPSAEVLAARGVEPLKILAESVNEGWNNSLPLTGTRPQPDFSVGFKREAFTEEQLDKLAPFIGNFISGDQSYFMATYYMYFPFLTCEVKCGATALDIADRQNAHSMTLAVRATVELFRLVSREMELHQEILAFSISHDHRSVRIYGHYALINGKDTKYYRHLIHTFNFTALDGKERWTAYKFTKNVYDVWMPSHFKRLCSAIDQIPADLDFSVSQLSQAFGLSEDLQRHNVSGSSQPDSQSQGNSQQSTSGGARNSTPTPFSQAEAGRRWPGKGLLKESSANRATIVCNDLSTHSNNSVHSLFCNATSALASLDSVPIYMLISANATKTNHKLESNLRASNEAKTATANEDGTHGFLAMNSLSFPQDAAGSAKSVRKSERIEAAHDSLPIGPNPATIFTVPHPRARFAAKGQSQNLGIVLVDIGNYTTTPSRVLGLGELEDIDFWNGAAAARSSQIRTRVVAREAEDWDLEFGPDTDVVCKKEGEVFVFDNMKLAMNPASEHFQVQRTKEKKIGMTAIYRRSSNGCFIQSLTHRKQPTQT